LTSFGHLGHGLIFEQLREEEGHELVFFEQLREEEAEV
jgi:hypothetical protein